MLIEICNEKEKLGLKDVADEKKNTITVIIFVIESMEVAFNYNN